jgi:hypothetical protein
VIMLCEQRLVYVDWELEGMDGLGILAAPQLIKLDQVSFRNFTGRSLVDVF